MDCHAGKQSTGACSGLKSNSLRSGKKHTQRLPLGLPIGGRFAVREFGLLLIPFLVKKPFAY
ncbi:hypothetical protein QE369_004231 [Agrobacterium larrymoorei]|uniref:Uncharacterized protein n=1 Tax=Agrobacterium larrymoorei TaxID=160699 RepID=A0AAJ2ETH8_9HYPH|nr:hypothetical protein [Agrobacterium larrymoorei]